MVPVGLALGGGDDMAVLDPDITDTVAAGGRIDDPAALDQDQHETPFFCVRRSWMAASTPAAVRSAGWPTGGE